MMHGQGQSDRPVVPTKSSNKPGEPGAEGMEGRGLAKGNPSQQNAPRAQHRDGARSALERVREVAERDKTVRFTTLLHHVYNVEHLRAAYHALKRGAAPGIDGETWEHYGEALEANLADLSGRLKRGAYRAKPGTRAYIPKADGRPRPWACGRDRWCGGRGCRCGDERRAEGSSLTRWRRWCQRHRETLRRPPSL